MTQQQKLLEEQYDLCIVGGGISGLSAAFHAHIAGVNFVLIEASCKFGGAIQTEIINDQDKQFVIERGPNSLAIGPNITKLIADLNADTPEPIKLETIKSNPIAKNKLIFDGKKLVNVTNPIDFLFSDFLSWSTKVNIFADIFRKPNQRITPKEESIEQFFSRLFGQEFADKLIWPILSGIYAGNIAQLSLESVFPKIAEAERKHGSLIRGLLKGSRTGASKRQITSFRFGLSDLVKSIVNSLPSDRLALNTKVHDISINTDNQICTISLSDGQVIKAKKTILATPAYISAQMLRNHDSEISNKLNSIKYAPIISVNFWLSKNQFMPDVILIIKKSFGFLSSRNASKLLGVIFNSSSFPIHAPEDKFGFTCFIGGANYPELMKLSDQEISDLLRAELCKVLNLEKVELEIKGLTRWTQAIPQYNLGHKALIESIEKELPPNVILIGNYLGGISLEDCVKTGRESI